MKSNTVVTACNSGYAWGAWLLVASMRKNGMDEPILIAARSWREPMLQAVSRFPDVTILPTESADRRSMTCEKPDIMLKTETEFVTWVDCDGFFSGNCSGILTDPADVIYIRKRTPSEISELYHRQRMPGENPDAVPHVILDAWQKDVGERADPAMKSTISANLISIHRSRFPFLEKWKKQMQTVLPPDVGVQNRSSFAYFQTDEAVLNSLLLFAGDAPVVTEHYLADRQDAAHYIHFSFNPKPWTFWNPRAFRHYETVMEIIEWAFRNGYAPAIPLPFSFRKQHQKFCGMTAFLAPNVNRAFNLKKRLFR